MKRIHLLIIVSLICILMNSCNGISADEKMCFPEELILGKLILSERKTHFIGPGGLDYGLFVYELEKNGIDNVKNGSLLFPTFPDFKIKKFKKHTTNPPTFRVIWHEFYRWQKTPILNDNIFLRRNWYYKHDKSNFTLSDFYGREISGLDIDIPKKMELKINKALKSNTSLYSFGGYYNKSILLVSLEEKLVFYLYKN